MVEVAAKATPDIVADAHMQSAVSFDHLAIHNGLQRV
jgi:hypothetical protein